MLALLSHSSYLSAALLPTGKGLRFPEASSLSPATKISSQVCHWIWHVVNPSIKNEILIFSNIWGTQMQLATHMLVLK